ncbi:hypothetical protein KAI92_00685 [Candidatus Parcubacteria bacterium]|nr:hypothetical protein [Candidatus Parcubacteria bacterium]
MNIDRKINKLQKRLIVLEEMQVIFERKEKRIKEEIKILEKLNLELYEKQKATA